ncbi:hypothetical protein M422DRAFT_257347 [Sphaerobolus stellatus SS14]|uniref:F-box domain-containing protein n=1 Tax=Sphaerobolus stellatus (strain SS14) TaxID=990650 RepID=A0A0C9UXX7_SPHS4|nr:hypothetical protein M422DRAFT_257347 [Sphaerobolus stellatus SS14]
MLPAELWLNILSYIDNKKKLLSLYCAPKLFTQKALEHLEWRHVEAHPGRVSLWIFIACDPRSARIPASSLHVFPGGLKLRYSKPTYPSKCSKIVVYCHTGDVKSGSILWFDFEVPPDVAKFVYAALRYSPPIKTLNAWINDETDNITEGVDDTYLAVDPFAASVVYSNRDAKPSQISLLVVPSVRPPEDIPLLTYMSAFLLDTIPRQIYLHMLLRIPALYWSRVARIFNDTNLGVDVGEKSHGLTDGIPNNITLYQSSGHRYSVVASDPLYSSVVNLEKIWDSFIGSVLRE